jgi:DNA-binding transcriptional regulator YdaS (Cro superfamily)
MSTTAAVRRACELTGSQRLLAGQVGVSVSMVSQWCTGARPLPPDRAIAIERATSGAVTVEELCPDIDWSVIRGKPPAPATQEAA